MGRLVGVNLFNGVCSQKSFVYHWIYVYACNIYRYNRTDRSSTPAAGIKNLIHISSHRCFSTKYQRTRVCSHSYTSSLYFIAERVECVTADVAGGTRTYSFVRWENVDQRPRRAAIYGYLNSWFADLMHTLQP